MDREGCTVAARVSGFVSDHHCTAVQTAGYGRYTRRMWSLTGAEYAAAWVEGPASEDNVDGSG